MNTIFRKAGYYVLGVVFIMMWSTEAGSAQSFPAERYPIIPAPTKLIPRDGYFHLNKQTKILSKVDAFSAQKRDLVQYLKTLLGAAPASVDEATDHFILLQKDSTISSGEGYHLNISPTHIVLSAAAPAGIFYGLQTMKQLLPVKGKVPAGTSELKLPAVEIKDAPVFSWRGMMLDVSRHFYSLDYVKKFIDRMALYKLNKLHLHLTDDQGWRIEIKKYPQLTEQGAWRTFDSNDSECIRLSKTNPAFKIDTQHIIHRNGKTLYGGFYTQAQMKNLIHYAAQRNIEIIPEVDMPGHMMAAIKEFPFLSCTGEAGHGKVFSVPICPCKDSTYVFAKNIYKEIFKLFPSKYVHIGGDEVDKTTWEDCARCKTTMEQNGLKDVDQLQSFFIKKMEAFFHANGKTLIGWDDVLDGGMDSSATIMYWRVWVPKAPVEAAKNGNDVIMTPDGPFYFDAWPNKHSLSDVYHYQPIPEAIQGTPYAEKIIGAQANLWAERIPSEARADYLTMPRMTALAEVAWDDHPDDYPSYLQRLQYKYSRWDQMDIHYRIPDLEGFTDNNVFVDSAVLKVKKPLPDLIIHYTTDGSQPTPSSPILPETLVLHQTTSIQLIPFTPSGNRGDLYKMSYEKENYLPALHKGNLQAGLKAYTYNRHFKKVGELSSASVDDSTVSTKIALPEHKEGAFGMKFKGYISVPETGIYSFYLTSDDGSVLTIGGKTVVDNDGLHSKQERSGQMALKKGRHPMVLDYIQGGGGYTLTLEYRKKGGSRHPVDEKMLSHGE